MAALRQKPLRIGLSCGAKGTYPFARLRRLANTITFVGSSGKIVLNVDSLSTFNLYRPADQDGVEVRPLRPFDRPPYRYRFRLVRKAAQSFEKPD